MTDRQTDGRTDGQRAFSSLDRVCIPCSAVKIDRDFSKLCSQMYCHLFYGSQCIIIIINEFHRDASLTKTSGPLCVTCFTSVNGTVVYITERLRQHAVSIRTQFAGTRYRQLLKCTETRLCCTETSSVNPIPLVRVLPLSSSSPSWRTSFLI